jgi:uncharacterized protein YegP (UPF0339 family)
MMAKRLPKLEVFEGIAAFAGESWYWHLRSANGQIQLHSEGYPTRAHAVRGAIAAQKAMARAILMPHKPTP